MGTTIASRSAARKLLTIVLVFALPVLVFCTLYVREALKDIAFLDAELTGVEISGLAYKAILDGSHRLAPEELARIVSLEAAIGLVGEAGFKAHLEDAKDAMKHGRFDDGKTTTDAKAGPHAEHESPLSGYLSDVGNASNLILDAEVTTFHLANAYVLNFPNLLNDVEALVVSLRNQSRMVYPGSSGAAQAQRLLGALKESAERVEQSLLASQSASLNPATYQVQLAAFEGIGTHLDALETLLNHWTTTTGGDRSTGHFERLLTAIRMEAADMTNAGLPNLTSELEKRRSALVWNLGLMLSLGLASGLVGLVLAARMFRQTLVQLDQVEDARKVAETALADTDRINHEVAKLNVDLADKLQRLNAAQDELLKKGKMEQLGQLTATVAHEIRNPLGAVRTSTFLLSRKLEGKGLNVDTQIDRINKAVVRCDNIITQLLDYSRSRKAVQRPERLDSWLAATVEEAARQVPAAVQIECVLGLDDAEASVDRARLERAVINMINNASEAMVGAGDDPAKFTTSQPRITISSFRRGAYVCIRVQDNGPGISAENLAKVREPLFTTKSFGTGLGVPAIEQIAMQHNGKLDIESSPGNGAIFTLFLPADAQVTGEAA